METLLRSSYSEINSLKKLIKTIEYDKERILEELKRFIKRPNSNVIESEVLKQKAVIHVRHIVNNGT